MFNHTRHLREIRLGIKNLLQHKLRSALTMLGMVFGVGSVIAMLAVGEGASQEALDQIRRLGSHNIIITAEKPVEGQQEQTGRSFMSIYGLRYQDQQRLTSSFPHVVRAVPVKIIRTTGRYGNQDQELRLLGTTPNWFSLVRRPLLTGRVLQQRDLEQSANSVVLTEQVARALLAGDAASGRVVRLGGEYFEVVGIVRSAGSPGGGVQTPDQPLDAYLPLNVARARFGDVFTRRTAGSRIRERVELHQIIVEVDRTEHVEATAAAIERMLQRFHKTRDYQISVPLALLRQAEATQRTFNIVLGSIAGISLLVGGIGIMNIMLAAVTERTREIGIRRAIGAKRRQIIKQFLIETLVLSTSGGLVGIAVGLLIPWVISQLAGMPTVVTGFSLLLSLGISLAVGIIFGLYPAVRAAALDPIEALRHE